MKPLDDMTEAELSGLLSQCAEAVMTVLRNGVLPPTNGGRHQFALVVFNDPKVAQYVSSCNREDMIAAMRETADRLERREDIPR